MKIYHFSLLIWEAFKNHTWGKVSNIHQTTDGWAFVIDDLAHGDSYVCVAYRVKSQKVVVMPNTADEFLAMTKKEDSNDLL